MSDLIVCIGSITDMLSVSVGKRSSAGSKKMLFGSSLKNSRFDGI